MVDTKRDNLILLVEDEKTNATVVTKRLNAVGFAVKWVVSGEEAVDFVKAGNKIALILMDIDLGDGINGITAAQQVLAYKELPILFVSGHSESQLIEETAAIAHYGYVVKGGEAGMLVTAVTVALRFWNEKLKRQQSEQLFQDLIQNIADVLFSITPDGKIVYISPNVRQELGYDTTDLLGKKIDAFVHADNLPEIYKIIEYVLGAANRHCEVEFQLRNSKGAWLWHGTVLNWRELADGSQQLYGVSRNIDLRKQAEFEGQKRLQQIHQDRENLQQIFDNAFFGMVLVDENFLITKVNASMLALLQKDEDSVVGKLPGTGLGCFTHVGSNVDCGQTLLCQRCSIRAILEQALESAVSVPASLIKITLIIKDIPKRVWLLVSATQLELEGEKQTLLTMADMTAYKNAETQKELLESRYRMLADNSTDGLWSLNLETNRWELISPACAAITGYSADELLQLTPDQLYPPSARPIIAAELAKRITEAANNPGKKHEFKDELKLVCKDGRRIWTEIVYQITKDGHGKLHMMGVTRDITERKIALEKLERSERRFREIAQSLPEIIFETDLSGKLTYANPMLFHLLDIAKAELDQGLCIEELFVKDDQANVVQILHRVYAGEQSELSEFTLVAKDGSQLPVLLRSIPIVEAAKVVGVRGVIIDVSERVQMETQMRQMEKMNAIGQLAAGIAHDFNNQVAGIIGMSQMLRRRLDEPKQQSYVDKILSCAFRTADLTKKLLAFSHQGKQEVVRVELDTVIDEVVDVLKHCIDRRIRVIHNGCSEALVVMGDSTQLQNALLNLGLNARDAMPNGGEISFKSEFVTLTAVEAAKVDPDFQPGKYVLVQVTDTGTGISAADLERVFEPFFTTKQTNEGAGMGLAAVFGTVKHHRGAIMVHSQEGEGSSFYIWLPAYAETTYAETNRDDTATPEI